ncbi:MAG: hypothetical protein ACYC0B_01510 [Gemmatimonadaceae bacterium]
MQLLTVLATSGAMLMAPQDTVRVEPAVIAAPITVPQDSVFRYSDAYWKRLDIHRKASYAILPLFVFQYAAGAQLFDKGQEAPAWARDGHPIGAIGIGALFLTNGVTGVMNLWEGRKDPDRETGKVVHAVMMLTAAGGFTATGFLASEAKRTDSGRRTHRAVAISSMAIATAAYLTRLEVFQ